MENEVTVKMFKIYMGLSKKQGIFSGRLSTLTPFLLDDSLDIYPPHHIHLWVTAISYGSLLMFSSKLMFSS